MRRKNREKSGIKKRGEIMKEEITGRREGEKIHYRRENKEKTEKMTGEGREEKD